ncbi:hypothetical protein OEZ86_000681 [Tetradesmus obliquus]|nr:hypothetical protein OEZ86_000681 [Tetradesmus obliquus]
MSILLLVNSTISSVNSDANGAGLSASDNATVTFVNTSLRNCSSRRSGGAISAADAAFINMTQNSSITDCSADQGGGGFSLTDSAVMLANDASFINNTAGGPASQDNAGRGGAAMLSIAASLTAANCLWEGNQARKDGGAMAAEGGALGVWNSARMVVHDSRIWGNTAHCWGGGAAVVFETGTLNISSSDVWNNTGRQQGGAVSAKDQAQVYITACNLSGNAASRRGGAVRIADSATVVLRDSIISGNQVGRLERCPKDSSPPSSSSTSCGGAVFIGDTPSGRSELASKVELINTTVAGNSAGRGGGLCAEPSAAASSSMPGQTTVRALAGDNTTFIDNSGSPGSDVYALAAAMLLMSPVGSNLNISGSSVFWNISCGMGSYLDPTRGTCTKCAAPSYILEEGEMRSTTQCQRCPEAAECFGGAVLVAKPKFYHTHGVNEARGTVPTCRLDILTR